MVGKPWHFEIPVAVSEIAEQGLREILTLYGRGSIAPHACWAGFKAGM
jgi:hypothetical protein